MTQEEHTALLLQNRQRYDHQRKLNNSISEIAAFDIISTQQSQPTRDLSLNISSPLLFCNTSPALTTQPQSLSVLPITQSPSTSILSLAPKLNTPSSPTTSPPAMNILDHHLQLRILHHLLDTMSPTPSPTTINTPSPPKLDTPSPPCTPSPTLILHLHKAY